MLHLTPSPLLDAGEALVGISLPMFVAALIAAFGDRFKQSVGRLRPDPKRASWPFLLRSSSEGTWRRFLRSPPLSALIMPPSPSARNLPAFEPTLARGL